jgi:hypothetical protein
MSEKSTQIRALRKKAADTSLSSHERESARAMAAKLTDQYGPPTREQKPTARSNAVKDTLRPHQWWVVYVRVAAYNHPDYDSKIAEPLMRLGAFLDTDELGQYRWCMKSLVLRSATDKMMIWLANEQVFAERRAVKKPKKPKRPLPVKDTPLSRNQRLIIAALVISSLILLVLIG